MLTDHVADMLLAPTTTARDNLLHEGVDQAAIHMVGDVMYDAALYYRERATCPENLTETGIEPRTFILCTIHRAENTESPERMRSILDGLEAGGKPVVLPLHPRTRAKLATMTLKMPRNVHVLDPVGYLEMTWLEANSRLILTDSGGVQKEAYFHGKRCVTLRDETEWVELVESGCNTLVGSDAARIAEAINAPADIHVPDGLYGDGETARRILAVLAP